MSLVITYWLFRPTWNLNEARKDGGYPVRRRRSPRQEAATTETHSEAGGHASSLARACSRSTGPRYMPRTRGTDYAEKLQCSCIAVAGARRSVGEHRTATVLDYRLRLYTEVPTLCCSVTRAILGGTFREAGRAGKREREREVVSARPSRSDGNRDDD